MRECVCVCGCRVCTYIYVCISTWWLCNETHFSISCGYPWLLCIMLNMPWLIIVICLHFSTISFRSCKLLKDHKQLFCISLWGAISLWQTAVLRGHETRVPPKRISLHFLRLCILPIHLICPSAILKRWVRIAKRVPVEKKNTNAHHNFPGAYNIFYIRMPREITFNALIM